MLLAQVQQGELPRGALQRAPGVVSLANITLDQITLALITFTMAALA